MSTGGLDPTACALFILGAFALAGGAQTLWLSSPVSQRLAWPIDCGRTFRGRRLFGDNKTLRGFVVMVPATAVAFPAMAAAGPAGVWLLSPVEYGVLGAVAGLGFMLAELPNSFLKRQLHVAPGAAATGRWSRRLFSVLDHVDSVGGALAAMTLVVRVPLSTVLALLVIGCLVHLGFSALTFQLGGKVRVA